MAGGFEELSNRAIAINKDLLKAYGGFLEPLNDGRGVIFFDDAGDAFVPCDGLINNTEVVLLQNDYSEGSRIKETKAINTSLSMLYRPWWSTRSACSPLPPIETGIYHHHYHRFAL